MKPERVLELLRNYKEFGVESAYTDLVREATEEIELATTKCKDTMKGRIAFSKHCVKVNPYRKVLQGYWLDDKGRQCLCDGYIAGRYDDVITSCVKAEEFDKNQYFAIDRVVRMPYYAKELRFDKQEIINHVSELEKKYKIKKVRSEERVVRIMEYCSVNINLLKILLDTFDGIINAYIDMDYNTQRNPIYIEAENGDGVILPTLIKDGCLENIPELKGVYDYHAE